VAGGEPIEAVTRALNARKVPSPRGGRWTHATVRWARLNVTYIAKRKHNGGPLLDGDWSALVDEETFWSGVALLTAGSRKVIRPGRAVWLLSLVAECAKCGGPAAARAPWPPDVRVPRTRVLHRAAGRRGQADHRPGDRQAIRKGRLRQAGRR
jgi:Recombinase